MTIKATKDIAILLVEDNQKIRMLTSHILRGFGLKNLRGVENGKAGLKALDEIDYDLIILDWNMPEMTGIEFLEIVKDSDEHGSIPVLMLTSHAERDYVTAAITSGATDYLLKPFTPIALQKKLERIFGKLT